jgi:hypothetical protein
MSKRNTRLRVWIEGQRLRWYSADGSRQSTPIPNFESLDKRQLENLRLTWELTLNNGRVNPLTGTVVTATMSDATVVPLPAEPSPQPAGWRDRLPIRLAPLH